MRAGPRPLPRGGRGAVLVLLLAVALFALDRLLPPDLSRFAGRSTVVVDAENRLLRPFPTVDGTWRLPTRPERVDSLYLSLLTMTEDRRYGWHPGVDPLAAIRAVGQAIRHRRVVSGASTLTMQVARLLSPRPRTLSAKLIESVRALQLQVRLGGDGVLEAYLTLAPFGGALEGVTAASLAWFGKEPGRLTPAEAALLVALPQSPERLRPDRHPQAAQAARDRVLDTAVAKGVLAREVATAAKAEPVPTAQRPMPMLAPHLAERLAAGAGRGTVVRTRLDGALQRGLEGLGRAQLVRFEAGTDLAVVVVANADRRVLAHLGSGDWSARQLDLSRAVRSPGSALKPFIYAVAFDDLSLHPGTRIADAPHRFGDWLPRNFDHDFHGTVTAREALQRSLNVPAVLALEKVGPARLAALLQLAGADLSFPAAAAEPGLPLALGGVGIRLTEMAMLYAGLADGGRMLPLSLLAGQPAVPPRRLVGEAAARAVIDILEGSPAPDGIATGSAVARPRRIAFKTGTSFGFRDAWTIGASADYTVAVWVGRPDGAPRPGEMGRSAAAPVLFRVFDLLPPDRGPRPAPAQPDHALFHRQPPPALARLEPESGEGPVRGAERLRILFPPDGITVESLAEGVALRAAGGRPPLRWVVDGRPLAEGASFWRPDGNGFARLVVIDADGRRAASGVRVVVPGK
ncbi:MAG: penicillin-binding protein 1C [Magnetospirillum sp.]|nr:penicillin-binding protein 1C [Magnetospirillum sp.]